MSDRPVCSCGYFGPQFDWRSVQQLKSRTNSHFRFSTTVEQFAQLRPNCGTQRSKIPTHRYRVVEMSSDSGRSSYESISNSYGNRSRSVSRSISGDEAEGIVYAAPPPPRSVPLPPSRGPGRPPPIGGYRRNFARRHDIVVGKPSLFLEYEDDVYRFPWELCQTRQVSNSL